MENEQEEDPFLKDYQEKYGPPEDVLCGFLDSSLDESRLKKANDFSKYALYISDRRSFAYFRGAESKREMSGEIDFDKQRDHAVHTLYNYLLGWYIFDHLPAFREAFRRFFDSSLEIKLEPYGKEEKFYCNDFFWPKGLDKNMFFADLPLVNDFGDVWPMVSLLHDVGYILEGSLSPATPKIEHERVTNGTTLARECSMNAPITLQARVQDYLAERRRLGFQLKHPELTLMDFARYVDSLERAGPLTLDVMIDWARLDKQGRHNPETWARRFKLLRPFIRYLWQFEPATAMPDESVFGPVPGWQMPHIYRDQEIIDLLVAAHRLGDDGNLRAVTYETLFGLLASTGLRVSEAIRLLDADVDLTHGMLTVRQTKFNKSRQLPLHPSTTAALLGYRTLRHQQVQEHADLPFFVGTRGKRLGKRLSYRQVNRVFALLRKQLGWINRGDHAAPRVHDLRHTFAVRRVLLWQAQGTDIDQAMLALSTYMGHAKISHTYWYLTAMPELMDVAAGKFEQFAQPEEVDYAD